VTDFTRRKERSASALFGKIKSLARTSRSRTTPLAAAKESSTTMTAIVSDGRRVGWLVGARVGGLVGRLGGDSIVGSYVGIRSNVGKNDGNNVG